MKPEILSNVTTSTPATRDEFLALFDESFHAPINANIDKPTTHGIVCFENLAMDSPQFGARAALIYGPGCSCETLADVLSRRLGEVPSRFQYPVKHYVK